MICAKAVKRLKEMKQSRQECIDYLICPDCGGTLVIITVAYISEKRCLTCGNKFDTDENGFQGG